MKTLIDDTGVSARSYYYLLDFNDSDGWKTIMKEFQLTRLCDLDIKQYIRLFELATEAELKELKSK